MRLLPAERSARQLVLIVALQTTSLGAVTGLGVLYLAIVQRQGPIQIGLAYTIAAAAAALVSVPVGHLADRVPPKSAFVVSTIATAVAIAMYVLITDTVSMILIITLHQCADRAAATVRGTYIARAFPGDRQVRVRGFLRAYANLGAMAGAGLSLMALTVRTPASFIAALLIAALVYGSAAVCVGLLPPLGAVPVETRARIGHVFADRRFMMFCVLNAFLAFQFSVLEIGLPLWADRTGTIPLWTIAVSLALNGAIVTLVQVRVGRFADGPRAPRSSAMAGLLLGVAAIGFGLSGTVPLAWCLALLVIAVVVHSLGEILQVAASWTIAFERADEGSHGQYQGILATSTATGLALGASASSVLVGEFGFGGWIAFAGIFVVAGALVPLVIRTRKEGPTGAGHGVGGGAHG